jgi:hypothetical protein
LIEGGRYPDDDVIIYVYDSTAVTSLLRVMVLRCAPPAELIALFSPEHVRVVEDGARLQACLARRRALLDAHCPLIPPLLALVHGYEEPTTTDELWAQGCKARQRAGDGAVAVPLRFSTRVHEKQD